MHSLFAFLICTSLLFVQALFPSQQDASNEGIPDNYRLLYQQDFENHSTTNDMEMTDAVAWRVAKSENNSALELFGKSDYKARVRSPFNIAMINSHRFGDFVLEVSLAQTGREYGHRDMCVFFGMKDPTNFYYVHIASVMDDHANNIFLVNDEPRVKISEKTSKGTDWGKTGSWHKVRIKRTYEDGLIQVFFDDMESPIMETHDKHFDYGYIGFGSFDDTGMVDNIKIWGTDFAPGKIGFLNNR